MNDTFNRIGLNVSFILAARSAPFSRTANQDPVIRMTATSITTWHLATDQCKETAAELLKKQPIIVVNDHPVANTPQAIAACSKSSNSISVPR